MSLRKLAGKIYTSVKYQLFKHLPKKCYPGLLKLCFAVELKEKLNIKHPQTINDKVQWLKLYDCTTIKTKLADKYAVRQWVVENIGEEYLIPMLGVWNKFDDIDFDSLPDRFVLKATHGCGCNLVVTDKRTLDIGDARKKFKRWMKINYAYYSGEIQYEKIQPRIIAEEYVENEGGELFDYKVFCFNGKARYIMFLNDRHTALKMAFYDRNWTFQHFTYSYPQMENGVTKPEKLDEIIILAEKLSLGFDIVRADFYILNDGSIKFGEMTFASAGGFCKWNPKEYNRLLGKEITLSKDGAGGRT